MSTTTKQPLKLSGKMKVIPIDRETGESAVVHEEHAGIYVELFHGRKSAQEHMDNWGEPGPIFGPLQHEL